MRHFILLIAVAMFLPFAGMAQAEQADSLKTEDGPAYTFPEDWLGTWKGKLYLERPGPGTPRIFPMQLVISDGDTTGTWNWTIIYGEGEKKDERKYLLVAQDSTWSHFVVDEQNSIYLDQYLIGNYMLSRFAVDQTLLFANYHLRGDRIESEIFTGKMDKPVVSGQDLPEDVKVDKVLSYPVGTMQRSVLWKQ